MATMRDDYICKDCKVIFEYYKPYGEDFPKNPPCSECGSTNTKRKMTLGNIVIPDHMKASQGFGSK